MFKIDIKTTDVGLTLNWVNYGNKDFSKVKPQNIPAKLADLIVTKPNSLIGVKEFEKLPFNYHYAGLQNCRPSLISTSPAILEIYGQTELKASGLQPCLFGAVKTAQRDNV